jgi:hypothetical protein
LTLIVETEFAVTQALIDATSSRAVGKNVNGDLIGPSLVHQNQCRIAASRIGGGVATQAIPSISTCDYIAGAGVRRGSNNIRLVSNQYLGTEKHHTAPRFNSGLGTMSPDCPRSRFAYAQASTS